MPDWKSRLRDRLGSLPLDPRSREEVVEEMAIHLEERYRDLLSTGATEQEAEAATLVQLHEMSGPKAAADFFDAATLRSLRSRGRIRAPLATGSPIRGNFLSGLGQDVRFGFRILARRPGFTAVALLTLALGIGSNAAIFALFNAVFLRPLSVANPDRLVTFTDAFSYPDYEDLRDADSGFSGLTAHTGVDLTLDDGGRTERVAGEMVTGNYFEVLGIAAETGRTFRQEEDAPSGTHPVLVLSHGAWQRRWGGDPGIVGRTLHLNKHPFTVIGIAPSGFRGTSIDSSPDLWIPMGMHEVAVPGFDFMDRRREVWLQVFGRLQPGLGLEEARARVNTVAQRVARETPDSFFSRHLPEPIPIANFASPLREALQPVLRAFLALVGCILLITCANLANLLLARATTRRQEMAVRQALGASGSRLCRQLGVESLLLAFLGGAAGLALVPWTTHFVASLLPATRRADLDLSLDLRVLLFTLAITLLTAFLFGVAPSLRAARPDLFPSLKVESGGRNLGRARLRNLLVVSQVAITMMLLVGSGLFLRSLSAIRSIDPGFNPSGFLTFLIHPGQLGYDETKGRALYRELQERLTSLPGVERVSMAQLVQLGFGNIARPVIRPGEILDADDESHDAAYNVVDVGYFATLGLPLVRGREFGSQDNSGSPQVILINESLARRLWPGEEAVGKQLQLPLDEPGPLYEVIGVVRDSKYHSLRERPKPYFYLPFAQAYRGRMALLVRGRGSPKALLSAVRSELRELDPGLPAYHIRTYDEYLGDQVALPRATAMLSTAFGLLALVLAAVGVYGVISYAVSQRTREIGIRLALGARPRDVFRGVVGNGMILTGTGLGAGLLGALALSRFMADLLYAVSPAEPDTFVETALILAAVSCIACLVPAWRAMRVDPLEALRYE